MSEIPVVRQGDPVKSRRGTSWIFVAFGVLVILGGGGYLAFEKLTLIKKVPAGWVISAIDPAGGAAKEEALRRYEAGQLSREQRAALLYQLMQAPILEIRTPHAEGKEVPVMVRPMFGFPDADKWLVELKKWTISVGGSVKAEGAGGEKIGYHASTAPKHLRMPGPGAGKHQVAVDLTYAIWEKGGQESDPQLMTERTMGARQELIVDGNLEDMVVLRANEFMLERVKQNIALMAVRMGDSSKSVELRLQTGRLPVGLAFEVMARKSGDEKYVRVGAFATSDRQLGVQIWEQSVFEGAKLVDLSFVPSRAVAFDARMGECFGGSLEWEALKILPEARLKRRLFGGAKYDPPKRVLMAREADGPNGDGAA